jgi:hypothetical protein
MESHWKRGFLETSALAVLGSDVQLRCHCGPGVDRIPSQFSHAASTRSLGPAFVALLPQSDFYGLNNDALMPIAFGMFLLAYARFTKGGRPLDALLCGLALSACMWTKTISVPLVVAGSTAFAFSLHGFQKRIASCVCFVLALATVTPLLIANLGTFGRLSGAFAKMQMEGQTIRPFAEWFHHPVLTFGGFVAFFSELTNFYWLGEQPLNHWHGLLLFNVPYVLVWVCPLATLAVMAAAPRTGAAWRLCIASLLVSVAFLVVTSAATDFGIRSTPSAWWTFPGFVGGRLIIGSLIPFSLLVAGALERIRSPRLRAGLFCSMALVLNGMSAWMLADCFTGRYFNLFSEL